ncbi:hypothetical protein IAT40_003486 [Kwoniella sp. CBS 6097]
MSHSPSADTQRLRADSLPNSSWFPGRLATSTADPATDAIETLSEPSLRRTQSMCTIVTFTCTPSSTELNSVFEPDSASFEETLESGTQLASSTELSSVFRPTPESLAESLKSAGSPDPQARPFGSQLETIKRTENGMREADSKSTEEYRAYKAWPVHPDSTGVQSKIDQIVDPKRPLAKLMGK